MSSRNPPRKNATEQDAFDWQSCLANLVNEYGLKGNETKAGVFWHLRESHSTQGTGEIFEAYPPDHPFVTTYREHAPDNPWLKIVWRKNAGDKFTFLGADVTPYALIAREHSGFYGNWMKPHKIMIGLGAVLFKQVDTEATLVIMIAILRSGDAKTRQGAFEKCDRDRFERDVVPNLCEQIRKHRLFDEKRFKPFLEAKNRFSSDAPEPEPVIGGSAPKTTTGGFVVCKHPLIAHKLTQIRESVFDEVQRKEKFVCDSPEFRRLLRELGMLIGFEATRDMLSAPKEIKTPRGHYKDGVQLPDKQPVIVPILRSGSVLAEGLQEMLPATIGHIGIHRDKDNPDEKLRYLQRQDDYLTEYLVSLPPPENRPYFLVDAVIGTGETMCRAIEILRDNRVDEHNIRVIAVISSLTGRQTIEQRFPHVRVFCAAVDKGVDDENGKREHSLGLNEVYGVVPGIGFVSERLFGFRAQFIPY